MDLVLQTDKYQLTALSSDYEEYQEVKGKVEDAKMKSLEVTRIYSIVNPSLAQRYEQAKERKKAIFPEFKEELLLHGTDFKRVKNICTNGLDPSFCEDNTYGDIVNLTESSSMASNYPEPALPGTERYMFRCRVLIGNEIHNLYHQHRQIPEEFDTKYKMFNYFKYGIVCKWQPEDILPDLLIVYKIKPKIVFTNIEYFVGI